MSEQRFCPHCGERIAEDAEQRFCMFCGEPLNNIPSQAAVAMADEAGSSYVVSYNRATEPSPSYHPSGWQTLASIFIIISVLVGYALNNQDIQNHLIQPYHLFYVFLLAPSICLLLSFGVLFKRANNVATRTALKLLIAAPAFGLIFIIVNILMDSENVTEFNELLNWINILSSLVFSCVYVYAYSLIVHNNSLSKDNRTWINLLGIFQSQGFLGAAALLAAMHDKVLSSLVLTQTGIVFLLFFNIIALWKMARCEAFANQYDTEAIPYYSLQNRQMLVAAILFVLFFILPLLLSFFPF